MGIGSGRARGERYDPCFPHSLLGPVVKESASRATDLGFDPAFYVGILSGSSHTRDLKLVLQWVPCTELYTNVKTGTPVGTVHRAIY